MEEESKQRKRKEKYGKGKEYTDEKEQRDDHLMMTSVRPECRVMLRRCLAIVVRKEGCQGDPGDFWMYESGYLLFQGLLSANSVCWWNSALNGATKSLVYRGYVSPGALLVGSEPCALEVLRGAWARRVLQAPAGYQIVSVEDIEDCNISTVTQTQWTPLPEAVCAVVLRLSSQGRPAGIETIRESLIMAFPHVSPPSERILYDTLVQLTTERKLYHTSRGYFIVTPERRRSRSHSRGRRRQEDIPCGKTMLMSTEEALVLVHGEMATIRDGDVTHQCIQTNLADVICGGNPSDKIIVARNNKRRSASFPAPKSPDRRGSFRLWGSTRRLRRSASTRTLAARHYTDSSSSTEYPTSSDSAQTPKKESLLSRLFRRSKRSQCQISTFSAQFPPSEWFNSKAIHLHNVGTQTSTTADDSTSTLPYYYSETASSKSATLPRRHRRQLSNDSTYVASLAESRDHSPSLRYGSSHASGSLSRTGNILRTPLHISKSRDSSRKTSRASLAPKNHSTNNIIEDEIKEDVKQEANSSTQKIIAGIEAQESSKTTSLESLKPSQKTNEDKLMRESEIIRESMRNLASIDNSGPSSIESQKSSKTGSSITSGPSSLESQKTVIQKQSYLDKKRSPKRKDSRVKVSPIHQTGLAHSNSFTLQVTTKQNGTNISNINTNATINSGANTKIYVQNSPVRSVITFENGRNDNTTNPNLVIINGSEPVIETNKYTVNGEEIRTKNTNNLKDDSLNNSANHIEIPNMRTEVKNEEMNNIRKLSLQMPSRDGLNYRNLIKNVPDSTSNNQNNSKSNPDSPITNGFREFTKNSFENPPSPTKSVDGITGSTGCVFSKNLTDSKTSLNKSYLSISEKNLLGSEPNIFKEDERDKTLTRQNGHQFPSLSDLSFNFTSLAAQKILKGVSINSIDTLVELNMAANGEKQNNCDIVHTDFGLV
ncbi:winged helix domain-containing protein [Holotrichia oblita]|uniref:Winged helix domain-containing protein n=1 Tax=Holotrichia oblita TaxID=644536 RepID=A0ACB9TGF6_HOLOL|nr:winged helix domain-containing protein [Holotrichia oblita]